MHANTPHNIHTPCYIPSFVLGTHVACTSLHNHSPRRPSDSNALDTPRLCGMRHNVHDAFILERGSLHAPPLPVHPPPLFASPLLSHLQMVLDMITRFKREGEADVAGKGGSETTAAAHEPEIDTLILLDRGVDVVSPMMTPLTFEALIDQVLGIENGMCVCVCAFKLKW